jgi:hypothetical protein
MRYILKQVERQVYLYSSSDSDGKSRTVKAKGPLLPDDDDDMDNDDDDFCLFIVVVKKAKHGFSLND